MSKHFLLKYDTQHIRVFIYQDEFIKFSHYTDDLLPLAEILFASSSTLSITEKQLAACFQHLQTFNSPHHNLIIYYSQKVLTIQYTYLVYKIEVSLNKERSSYWYYLFQKQSNLFSTSEEFGLPYSGKKDVEDFFNEMGIGLPNKLSILNITYYGDFFFIPLEFLYYHFLVKHCVIGKVKSPKPIKNVAIIFDPDLTLAQEESLYTLKLLEKRSFLLNNKDPELLLISAHGSKKEQSQLNNKILEEIVKELDPHIVIFNSCLLAQEIQGIISHFLQNGSCIITSPFHVLCNKTVFAPLLKFLSHTDDQHVWTSFMMLRIFYPNIYRYFRYYCTKEQSFF